MTVEIPPIRSTRPIFHASFFHASALSTHLLGTCVERCVERFSPRFPRTSDLFHSFHSSLKEKEEGVEKGPQKESFETMRGNVE